MKTNMRREFPGVHVPPSGGTGDCSLQTQLSNLVRVTLSPKLMNVPVHGDVQMVITWGDRTVGSACASLSFMISFQTIVNPWKSDFTTVTKGAPSSV